MKSNKSTMKVVHETILPTVNRGDRKFLVSQDQKTGEYFAHEVGRKEQIAEIMDWDQFKAHRLNPTKRFGNQYGTFHRTVGLPTIADCIKIIEERAETHVQYY